MRWLETRAHHDELLSPDGRELPLRQHAENLQQLFDEVRRLQRHINDCVRRLHDPVDARTSVPNEAQTRSSAHASLTTD